MFYISSLRHFSDYKEIDIVTLWIPYKFPHLSLLWNVLPCLKEIRIDNKLGPDTQEAIIRPDPLSMNRGTPYSAQAYMFLLKVFLPLLPQVEPIKKIYISRSKASKRRVTNEEKFNAFLESRGFTRIYMEDVPPLVQMAICANADVVISPHGAALTNTLFCRAGTKVIEICTPKMRDLQHFEHIAVVRYLNYMRLIADPTSDSYEADMHVDLTNADILIG